MMAYSNNFVAALVCQGDIVRELRDGCGNHTVLIPFGSEYKLRFKNKEARKAVVQVEVDGRNATEFGWIIVGPNETVDLEGWMDKSGNVPNKFKFIQKTKEIQQHRGDKIDDGLITVRFRFEKHPPVINRETTIKETIHRDSWPYRDPWYPYPYPWDRRRPIIMYDSIAGHSLLRSAGERSLDMTFSCSCNNLESGVAPQDFSAPMADEGITVEGSANDQSFGIGHTQELEEVTHTITFQVKGIAATGKAVRKPVTVRGKIKCKTCGRSNKSSERFCSNCGTAVLAE